MWILPDKCIGSCLAQPDNVEASSKTQENPYFKNEKPIYFLSHRLSHTANGRALKKNVLA